MPLDTPPPPPPPPPSTSRNAAPPTAAPQPPAVASSGPPGSLLVKLLIFNGHPFKNHWAYFVPFARGVGVGVLMHAAGDVRTGFEFQIRWRHNFDLTGGRPMERIPLQWIDPRFLDEAAMFGHGSHKIDSTPVCLFEASAAKIQVPEKSLNSVADTAAAGRRVIQRDCQTLDS
ncbi:hypothetical protein GGTG_02151 [Gaeumannomyces tritici R3-111a-1]|uniref:Uncharacterized protein n=1 Tax=Gaeumannomyces tritici (strain R3-111a-1) TaxID=644352 RepID=J3NLK2_GAET3|nr:hypothetical protein GGTG_02151 [Gaeumannomyces tritici R3-111a-1]EJT82177.1 hypothetical protein GGTG_02151 [Gaeumannomyces tritici R3-111a-1]